jgi:hypothetical protein
LLRLSYPAQASAKQSGSQITGLDRYGSSDLCNDQQRIWLTARRASTPDENDDGKCRRDKNCDFESHSKPRSEKETSKDQRHRPMIAAQPLTGG